MRNIGRYKRSTDKYDHYFCKDYVSVLPDTWHMGCISLMTKLPHPIRVYHCHATNIILMPDIIALPKKDDNCLKVHWHKGFTFGTENIQNSWNCNVIGMWTVKAPNDPKKNVSILTHKLMSSMMNPQKIISRKKCQYWTNFVSTAMAKIKHLIN